jgi:hypothetical protein
VLAGEVGSRHKCDLAAGLRGYEERMRPLIDDLQKIPLGVPTVFAPQTAWEIWLRNTVFALICWTRILEFVQLFFVGSFSNLDKYALPDYHWVR